MARILEFLLIAIAGLFGGRLVATALSDIPSPDLAPRPPVARAAPQPPPTHAFLDRNLFHAERERPAKSAPPIASEECIRARSRARLVGTVVSSAADRSVAVFAPAPGQSVGLYEGESLNAATVRHIERAKVVVERDGHCELYFLDDEAEGLAESAARPAAPDALGASIHALGAERYEIPRRSIDEALSNPAALVGLARIVPAFVNGSAAGFRLSAVRPDSLLTHLGLQSGDLIERINGYELTSPSQGMELYTTLRERSVITVDLVRGGARRSVTYEIR